MKAAKPRRSPRASRQAGAGQANALPRLALNVAVTGLIASESPGPGAGIIRALRADPRFTGRVIGLAYDAKESAIYLRELCDEVYLIPYPSAGSDALWERLDYILGRTKIDLILPSLDTELNSFNRLAGRLAERGVQMFLPDAAMLDACSKKSLARICARAKIGYPKTIEITSFDKLRSGAEEIGYPVYVKGIFYEAELARNAAELEKSAHSIFSRWGLPLLLQQPIVGDEFDLSLVGDGTGHILGLTAMRKMALSSKNKAWGGMTIDAADLLEPVRKMIKALKWRGPAEFEIMRRRSDGRFFIIEINPRFPAWIYFSHGAGCNLPILLLDHLVREAAPAVKAPRIAAPGQMFLRVATDVIVSLDEYEALLTRGELIRRP